MAKQYLTAEQSISFYKEPSPCTPPANWPNDGTAIEYVSCNLDGVTEELLEDPTAEAREGAVGNRHRVKGRRNGTFTVVCKMHGVGTVTASGATVAQTALGELITSCYGGAHLGTSHVIVGGSATAPELNSVAGIVPGCMLAFEDISSPTLENDGFPVCRRVLSVDGDTKVITLSEALPWTPAADDPVHACITVYRSSHILRDAVAAGQTYCWYIKHGDTADLQYRLDGCAHSGSIEGLSLGGLPTFTINGQNANHVHGAEEGLTDIADLGEPEGFPQLGMGLDMTLSIQEVGNTAPNIVVANAVEFDAGTVRSKVESVTKRDFRFHGLATYSLARGQTTLSVTLAEYDNDWLAGLNANKRYRVTLTQPGAGGGAGSGFCIHLPNAHLVSTPGKTAVGDNHGTTLVFEASESNDTIGGSNVDLQKSRFLVALF